MIKIGLFSEDNALFLVLSSVLGRQFEVKRESSESAMFDLISSGGCDVMVLDGVSNPKLLPQQVESFGRLMAQSVPSVIMGDSTLRTTALELVRAGAFVISTDLLQFEISTVLTNRAVMRNVWLVEPDAQPACA